MSVKVTKSKYVVWTNLDRDFTDFEATIIVYPQSDVAGYGYGFIFREEDNRNFYRAQVSVDGKYSLYKLIDGKWTTIVSRTQSKAIQADENALRLVCFEDTITFYVNDALLFTVQDNSFSHGDLGVFVSTGDSPDVQVQFDDFVAYVAKKSDLPQPTSTPHYTWADYLYFDLVASREDYRKVNGWYQTLSKGGSIKCPSQSYAVHRPNYVIPAELPALRSIYDRYIGATNLVDGVGDEIGPLDRIQLLCREGKNIGQNDMNFDMQKLAQAEPMFDNLIAEVQTHR
jgi:hypothetical protein